MARNRLTRSGFTLIEMMVAMALSLGIMLILTESFKMALDFVRSANSTGEMISQLNGAGILLTRDLQTDHFIPDPSAPTPPALGGKLSDQHYDIPGWTPPLGGFFRIVAPVPTTPIETSDPQGFNINSPANPTTVPPTGHLLHFTSYIPTSGGASSFTAIANSGTPYSSQYAEIAYFLAPMGKKTSVLGGGQDLYNLIRRQRLVANNAGDQASLATGAGDPSVISAVGPNVNLMTTIGSPTIVNPANRLQSGPPYPTGLMPAPPGDPRYGEDIVVSNVLSFEVKADWTGAPAPTAFPTNTDAPYDYLPSFDTASTPSPTIRVKSLQVVIRIYDPRLKAARQNTWKFAM